MKKTLYDYLGLDDKASIEEIEAMYRTQKARLAGAIDSETQNEFKFVQQAYAVLSDPMQRTRYDQSLASMKSADDAVIYYSSNASSNSHPFRALVVLAVIAFAGYEAYQHFYPEHLNAAAKTPEGSTARDDTATSGNPEPPAVAAEITPAPAPDAVPPPPIVDPEPPAQQAVARQPATTDIYNVDAVPIPVPAKQRSAYMSFLSTPSPRAFVICDDGRVMTIKGNKEFVDKQLATLPGGCAPYAVDDSVVWNR